MANTVNSNSGFMSHRIFDNSEQLVEFVAKKIQSLAKSGPSHLSFSGGSTPKILFKRLAEQPYRSAIQWQNLHIWWGDERMVPAASPDSNYGECQRLLLDHIDIPATNIHHLRGDSTAEAELVRAEQELRHFFNTSYPRFDLILLGMGNDGHIASLFPDGIDLNSDNWLEIARQPQTGQLRISSTLKLINAADEICVMVTGAAKNNTLQQLFCQTGEARLYPAFHLRPSRGSLVWLLDRAAAAGIEFSGENNE